MGETVLRATLVVSAVVYACVIGSNFQPAVRAKQVEAFGAMPLGLPVTAVVVLAETVLFTPMPWVFWHGMQIAFQAARDGRWISPGYLLTVGGRHPHLRRSQVVCLGGLAYFVVLCAAWIVYAEAQGI